MSKKIKDNKIVSLFLMFLGVATAIIAFWIFFDWFNFKIVKKEAFFFSFKRHILMPCILSLAYTVIMQTRFFNKDDD